MPSTMDRATARAIPDEAPEPGRLPDGLSIRYLDGSTTATPLAAALVQARRSDLRVLDREAIPTARLLAGLSMALDLTEGQLPGHALRTCFLAMHLADDLGLSLADRGALFYGAFLKDAGCSSNAAAITRIFGADDIEAKRRQSTIESLAARVRRVHDPDHPEQRAPAAQAAPAHLARHPRPARASRRSSSSAASAARRSPARPASTTRSPGPSSTSTSTGTAAATRAACVAREIHPLARILAACQGLDIFLDDAGPRARHGGHGRARRHLVRPGHRRSAPRRLRARPARRARSA